MNSQTNRVRIAAGLYDKVVFEFALVSVEREINSRIDIFVNYFSECRHLRVPLRRIISDSSSRDGTAGEHLLQPRCFSISASDE